MAGGHGPDKAVTFPRIKIVDVAVTVAGGTGSNTFTETGEIRQVCIDAPAGASYTILCVDSDGFGIFGETGLIDDRVLDMDTLCLGTNTITITGTDGVYSIRLRLHLGSSVGT